MKRASKSKENKELVIMVNDPSLTGWGWVVLKIDGTVLACGCIKTEPQNKVRRIRKGDDDVRRIAEINAILLRRIRHYRVNYLLSELPHGSQSSSAAKMIGITAAIGQTLSQALDIPIEWFSENDAKQCLLEKSSATKKETIDEINKLYTIPWTNIKYKDEAIADAVAIFNVAVNASSALQFFRR